MLDTVTIQSLELMHHILTQNTCVISQDFLHAYISLAIRSCEMVDTTKESKQVKQVKRRQQKEQERVYINIYK
jgi:hypothetical protein